MTLAVTLRAERVYEAPIAWNANEGTLFSYLLNGPIDPALEAMIPYQRRGHRRYDINEKYEDLARLPRQFVLLEHWLPLIHQWHQEYGETERGYGAAFISISPMLDVLAHFEHLRYTTSDGAFFRFGSGYDQWRERRFRDYRRLPAEPRILLAAIAHLRPGFLPIAETGAAIEWLEFLRTSPVDFLDAWLFTRADRAQVIEDRAVQLHDELQALWSDLPDNLFTEAAILGDGITQLADLGQLEKATPLERLRKLVAIKAELREKLNQYSAELHKAGRRAEIERLQPFRARLQRALLTGVPGPFLPDVMSPIPSATGKLPTYRPFTSAESLQARVIAAGIGAEGFHSIALRAVLDWAFDEGIQVVLQDVGVRGMSTANHSSERSFQVNLSLKLGSDALGWQELTLSPLVPAGIFQPLELLHGIGVPELFGGALDELIMSGKTELEAEHPRAKDLRAFQLIWERFSKPGPKGRLKFSELRDFRADLEPKPAPIEELAKDTKRIPGADVPVSWLRAPRGDFGNRTFRAVWDFQAAAKTGRAPLRRIVSTEIGGLTVSHLDWRALYVTVAEEDEWGERMTRRYASENGTPLLNMETGEIELGGAVVGIWTRHPHQVELARGTSGYVSSDLILFFVPLQVSNGSIELDEFCGPLLLNTLRPVTPKP